MKAIVPAWRANSISHNWFNEFDQLFDTFFEQKPEHHLRIACDIDESENYILFSFDMPGMDEKDIHIELQDSVLHISGERKQEKSSDAAKSFKGLRYGKVQQSFRVPKTIEQDAIEADYTNGVLKVLLPKAEKEKPRKVEVKSKKSGLLSGLLGKDTSSSTD